MTSCREKDKALIFDVLSEANMPHCLGYVAGRINRGIGYTRRLAEELRVIVDRGAKHVGNWTAFIPPVPIGTRVRYWTGVREGEGKIGKTRSEVELLSGHTLVVWIEGCVGCVALSHVEVIEEEEPFPCSGAKEEAPL